MGVVAEVVQQQQQVFWGVHLCGTPGAVGGDSAISSLCRWALRRERVANPQPGDCSVQGPEGQ